LSPGLLVSGGWIVIGGLWLALMITRKFGANDPVMQV
jgi:hypothetical protein